MYNIYTIFGGKTEKKTKKKRQVIYAYEQLGVQIDLFDNPNIPKHMLAQD